MKNKKPVLTMTLDVCLIKNSIDDILHSNVTEESYLEVFKVLSLSKSFWISTLE